jgi:hypothetical protein
MNGQLSFASGGSVRRLSDRTPEVTSDHCAVVGDCEPQLLSQHGGPWIGWRLNWVVRHGFIRGHRCSPRSSVCLLPVVGVTQSGRGVQPGSDRSGVDRSVAGTVAPPTSGGGGSGAAFRGGTRRNGAPGARVTVAVPWCARCAPSCGVTEWTRTAEGSTWVTMRRERTQSAMRAASTTRKKEPSGWTAPRVCTPGMRTWSKTCSARCWLRSLVMRKISSDHRGVRGSGDEVMAGRSGSPRPPHV